jgi:hypothetical protein
VVGPGSRNYKQPQGLNHQGHATSVRQEIVGPPGEDSAHKIDSQHHNRHNDQVGLQLLDAINFKPFGKLDLEEEKLIGTGCGDSEISADLDGSEMKVFRTRISS